jgi:ATP-dependent Lon protease
VSKRSDSGESDDLPAGYELVRFDPRVLLALPAELARTSRQELDRRAAAADEARREDLRKRQEAMKAEALAEGNATVTKNRSEADAKKRAFAAPPAPGWYRVLPELCALLDERNAVGGALRSADQDVNKRNAQLREVLIEKGPDRRIARHESWREMLAELEAALPHFQAPIRLLRNTLALAEATSRPVRVPPMLLLGPPGVGKTYFSHRVAQLLGAAHAAVAFDQPTAGSQLRGSDKYWGNSASGLLFNLICMGDCANPVVLLDELDKSCVSGSRGELDPLAQLHGALEPETSRRTLDISTDIEFDASLTTYIATANTVRGIDLPILSRLEVFAVEPPCPSDSVEIARAIMKDVFSRLGLSDRMRFDRKALYVLAHMSPRLMVRTVEKAAAAAVVEGRSEVREADVLDAARVGDAGPRLH